MLKTDSVLKAFTRKLTLLTDNDWTYNLITLGSAAVVGYAAITSIAGEALPMWTGSLLVGAFIINLGLPLITKLLPICDNKFSYRYKGNGVWRIDQRFLRPESAQHSMSAELAKHLETVVSQLATGNSVFLESHLLGDEQGQRMFSIMVEAIQRKHPNLHLITRFEETEGTVGKIAAYQINKMIVSEKRKITKDTRLGRAYVSIQELSPC